MDGMNILSIMGMGIAGALSGALGRYALDHNSTLAMWAQAAILVGVGIVLGMWLKEARQNGNK